MAPDFRQRRHQKSGNGNREQHGAQRMRQERREIAVREHQSAIQVVPDKRSEHEGQQQRRRFESAPLQQVSPDAEKRGEHQIKRAVIQRVDARA